MSNPSPANAAHVLPPEKPGLVQQVKNLILPAPEPQNQNPAAGSPSENSSEFERTASEIENKYASPGVGGGADGGNAAGGSTAAGAESSQVNAPPLPGHFAPPEAVEGFLLMITDALAKRHGEHWKMSDTEKLILVPTNVAMLDEQGPKIFGNLDNPALWTWAVVMTGWVSCKSETVGKAMELAINKIFAMFDRGKAQGTGQ